MESIDMEPAQTSPKMSRRSFAVLAAAAAGATVVGGFAVLQSSGGGPQAVRTFGVTHDDSVYVTMTNGAPFVVQVKQQGTGKVLEQHNGVTAYNLLALESEYVSIAELA